MRHLRWAAAAATALTLTLTACSGDEPDVSSTPTSQSPSPSPTESEAPTPSAAPESDRPPAELDWQPVAGPIGETVTRNTDWTLTVKRNGAGWSLDGPQAGTGGGASGWRVSDALLDEDWAVVVLADRTETKPSRAEVTDLATGDSFVIDGSSDVPATTGGSWALGDGRLLHATYGPGRAYCLASVDLDSRESSLGWCAPKQHGFNGARIAPGGTSVLSFNAGRISCRTLMSIDGTEATPFDDVEECTAWDGLRTDDGLVWSVIAKERQIETADFFAREGGELADLGPGTAGSLVWCGDAAYFVRDPQDDGDPAALMRWAAADGLSVAYESPGGRAFLSEPRCGGDHLTITALAEAGDEQVTASLS
ncbi:MAG: hypothetical protein WBP61_15635 [Nocardioides sp.]